MAKKQINQAIEKLLRSATQLNQKLTSQERFWLMRSGFIGKPSQTEGGFILPTVTLLLVMLSLVLGILIFRTGNRTNQIIGERQQRQIYNATTPAVERAKAKLEFLFTEDTIPALPSEADIVNALAVDANYTLPDETRVDLNNDGTPDNAWTFWFDADGNPATAGPGRTDGSEIQVAYSLLSYASEPGGVADPAELQDPDNEKAAALVVRNGPINLSGGAGNPNCPNPGLAPFQGWQQVTGSALRKAIQVHAFAQNANTGVVSTLEMQQDKQANLGNKWGAWFRNDMEIFPGPDFRWNGAMNVAGSYVVGGNRVQFYPISSPSSCVYTPDNSELVMGDIPQEVIDQAGNIDGNNATGVNGNDRNGGNPFRGQFVIGTLRDNNFNGSAILYPHSTAVGVIPPFTTLNRGNDSVVDATVNAPGDVALDPVILLTQAQNRTRANSDNLNPDVQTPAWNKDGAVALNWWVEDERLHNEFQPTPFVDDTYRADNRWGPKPLYSEQPFVPAPADGSLNVADPSTNEITVATAPGDNAAERQSSFDRLTRNAPPASNTTDEESYGLDGYWERRANAQGVRIIVGQRLELGNAHGWGTEVDANGNNRLDPEEDLNNNGLFDFDPLYPPPINAADVASARVDMDGAAGPLPAMTGINTNGTGSMENRQHEMRQWRTLRNNVAAAQSATLYHYLMSSGDYPVACIASAVHPGTEQTIRNSTTFNALPGGGNNPNVSFLTGEGTNGWEFYPPEYTAAGAVSHGNLVNAQAAFIGEINDGNSDLRTALDNLGYFAGDPAGAFPAFQDTIGGGNGNDAANLAAFREPDQLDATIGPVVHPYPIQSMWGDFSNLRRVMDKLNGRAAYGNTAYADLSLADQTTLQTASCTLGILAYNVNNVLNHPDAVDASGQEQQLGNDNRDLINAIRDLQISNRVEVTGGNVEVDYVDFDDDDNDGNTTETLTYRTAVTGDEVFDLNNPAASALPAEVILKALRSELSADDYDIVKAVHDRQQIVRDRALGFSQGMVYDVEFGNFAVLGHDIGESDDIRLQCDYIASDYFGLGEPTDPSTEAEFLTLALTLCPNGAKYPSLAYIFPDRDRAHDGVVANNADLEPEQEAARQQPQSEPYTSSTLEVNGADFSNAYTFNRTAPTTGSGSSWNGTNDIYKVVGDNDNDGILEAGENDLNNIALVPKAVGDWAQPTATTAAGRINAITDNTGTTNTAWAPNVYPAFLDKGTFNGREMMAIRITDIDLDLLRRNQVTGINNLGGTTNTDWWLPLPEILDPGEAPTRTGAAIYAFREDTVREDAIARPTALNLANTNAARDTWLAVWRNYVNDNINVDYLMNAVGDTPLAGDPNQIQDPPANPINGISPKPVDFYADPDRRPHGFRLRNGADLRRIGAAATDLRGMSFVSDNPVYIQGDFNLHSEDGTRNNLIQEFTQLLADNWNNFFTRATINEDFARAGDSWRASEIVGDGISLLSDEFSDAGEFHDGWISQGILNNNGAGELSPFRTLNRPDTTNLSWVREDGTVALGNEGNKANYDAPIKISQRGFPVYCSDLNLNNRADSGALNGLATGLSCAAFGGEEREFGLRSNNGDRGYRLFSEGKDRINAPANTYMNMLMVSGTNPSRANQSNGGLHNFPRFLESFGGDNLWIAGSIYQLAFSTSATGPFDQDSWEPGQLGVGPENIRYYAPPNRRWGYDTALQLVQPAPIAQRFASPSNIRSEFYRELDVDDPYIVNLRCVVDTPDPDLNCP